MVSLIAISNVPFKVTAPKNRCRLVTYCHNLSQLQNDSVSVGKLSGQIRARYSEQHRTI
jgi:hypothetical protein